MRHTASSKPSPAADVRCTCCAASDPGFLPSSPNAPRLPRRHMPDIVLRDPCHTIEPRMQCGVDHAGGRSPQTQSAQSVYGERRRWCASWRAGHEDMRAVTEWLCSPGCPPEPGVQGSHLLDGVRGTRNEAPRSQFAARCCVSSARENREWSAVLTDLCTASMICLNMYSIWGPPAACAAGWDDAGTDIGESLCEMRGYGGDGRRKRAGGWR